MTENEKILRKLLKSKAMIQGTFTLSSGVREDFYFDCRMLSMSSRGAALIGDVVHDRTCGLKFDAIGGPQSGAIPIATAAAISYGRRGRRIEGFWTRNDIKGYGTGKAIEGNIRVGDRVVIVDDVVTSGMSILKAAEVAMKASLTVVAVTALIDRGAGAEPLLEQYGLDYRPIFTLDDFKGGIR